MFRDEKKQRFAGINAAELTELLLRLEQDVGLGALQRSESLGFSVAMIARAALGLSSEDARILIIADGSDRGLCSLVAARHLINSGSECEVLLSSEEDSTNSNLSTLLKPIRYSGAVIRTLAESPRGPELEAYLSSFHAAILGCEHFSDADFIEKLNDNNLPVHCIMVPPGIKVEDGSRVKPSLFASSTISLGVPLETLTLAQDFTGRLYLCDCGIPKKLLSEFKCSQPALFAEQPVIRIFVEEKEEN